MKRLLLILCALVAAPCYGQGTRIVTKGDTDVNIYIRIVDSALGTPETGVDHSTSGLDLEYIREGATATDLTESTLAAVDSTHSDGGIKHVGNGLYRVCVPDAAFATGVDSVIITGAVTDMVVIPCVVQLSVLDLQTAPATVGDITDGVDGGDLGAAWADGGRLDLIIDAVLTDTNELQTDWVNGGRLDLLIDAIKTVTDLISNPHTEPTGPPANNETIIDYIHYLAMNAFNEQTVTSAKKTIKDGGGVAEFEKDLSDDGTTYTESEANAP